MKTVFATGGLLLAGVLTWQIGSRLSTDAVGIGVGLVFGVLAGIPAALLVLATSPRTGGDGDDYVEPNLYRAGYMAGVRDTTNLARGMARQLPEHDKISAEWHDAYERQRSQPPVIVVNPPADDDDVIDVDAYTYAYPFGHHRQFRITGETE